MKILTSISFALAMMLGGVSAAQAATINITDGKSFCESRGNFTTAVTCDLGGNADFGQTARNTLVFLGEGKLHGYIADQAGITGLYADVATLVLMQDSLVTFSVYSTRGAFDGTLTLAPGLTGRYGIGQMQTTTKRLAAGTYLFDFDAAIPDENVANRTQYTLDITAVPLPASGLLILGALAALGTTRRRKPRA